MAKLIGLLSATACQALQYPTERAALAQKLATLIQPTQAALALKDADAAKAAQWTQDKGGQNPAGYVSLHLDEALLTEAVCRELGISGYYHVNEHVVLPAPENHFDGTVQLCQFTFRTDRSTSECERYWQDQHAPIACQTQSTVGYLQNRVLQSHAACRRDGLVEEFFRAQSHDSLQDFFAASDKVALKKNIAAITGSSAQFIDMTSINVIHMSYYPLI